MGPVRDFKKERRRMVEEQLISRGIKDERVLDAMMKVPREKFVPENSRHNAYGDYPLPIGEGQTISQPYIVALMLEKLCLKGGEKVLEIGAGSGYEAALLGSLCREAYTVERIAGLIRFASENLKGFHNIRIKEGDGYFGWEEYSPYEGIIVACAISEAPPPLIGQLDDGGHLVIPIGGRFSQELTVITKKKGEIYTEEICGCVFVPLITDKGVREK